MEILREAVSRSAAWLDAHNGTAQAEQTLRILKVSEEAGEAAGAWIGVVGQNPRKGVTHDLDGVAGELADTALVAIQSLGLDAFEVLERCAAKVLDRIPENARDAPRPVTAAACEATSAARHCVWCGEAS